MLYSWWRGFLLSALAKHDFFFLIFVIRNLGQSKSVKKEKWKSRPKRQNKKKKEKSWTPFAPCPSPREPSETKLDKLTSKTVEERFTHIYFYFYFYFIYFIIYFISLFDDFVLLFFWKFEIWRKKLEKKNEKNPTIWINLWTKTSKIKNVKVSKKVFFLDLKIFLFLLR